MAAGSHISRAATAIVATVAEVTVNRKTGQVQVTKFTTGQDCGLVVHQKNVAQRDRGESGAVHEPRAL